MSVHVRVLRIDLQKLVDQYAAIVGPADLETFQALEQSVEWLGKLVLNIPFIDETSTLELALKEVRRSAKLSVDMLEKLVCQEFGFCLVHDRRYDKVVGCKNCKKI